MIKPVWENTEISHTGFFSAKNLRNVKKGNINQKSLDKKEKMS